MGRHYNHFLNHHPPPPPLNFLSPQKSYVELVLSLSCTCLVPVLSLSYISGIFMFLGRSQCPELQTWGWDCLWWWCLFPVYQDWITRAWTQFRIHLPSLLFFTCLAQRNVIITRLRGKKDPLSSTSRSAWHIITIKLASYSKCCVTFMMLSV